MKKSGNLSSFNTMLFKLTKGILWLVLPGEIWFNVSLSNVLCMGTGNGEPIQHIIDLKEQFPLDIKTQPSVSTGDVCFCRERNCK